jgi:hypothetical protein
LARIFFSLFLWPLIAIKLIRDRLTKEVSGGRTFRELEDIRNAIEAQLFSEGSSANVFEFRDSFYRFAGLEQASLEKISRSSFEIFKVSGHPNAILASRVLARTNLRKIEDHKTRAKAELADVLSRNGSGNRDIELRDSVARLTPSLINSKPFDSPIQAETCEAASV